MAKFCELYLLLNSGYKAVLQAGYKAKDDQNAMVISSHLLSHPKVRKRLQELQAVDLNAKIMSVAERKERLSHIARADLVDFTKDGIPTLARSIPHHEAASEFTTRELSLKDGGSITTRTIKLRDPVTAIAELNKMEKVYEDKAGGVDNRQIHITNIHVHLSNDHNNGG